MAQSGGGDFDKPLKRSTVRTAPQQAGQPQTRSSTVIKEDAGDDEYELRIQGENVSASINGKAVPEDRIRRSDDKVEILDRNGKVIKTFSVSTKGGVTFLGKPGDGAWMTPGQGMWVAPGQPGAKGWSAVGFEPPKVMLGINMVDQEDGVQIAKVIEGLPADKGGLEENDVITEIDGDGPVSAEKVREALKDKKAGDTVTFTVDRDGESKKIKIKLAEYDAEKLGHTVQGFQFEPGEGLQGFDNEEMHKMLQEHMKRFEGQGHGGPPMVWGPGGEGEGNMKLLVPRSGGDSQLSGRIKELEARMKELDKRLEKLDQQLTKLQEHLER